MKIIYCICLLLLSISGACQTLLLENARIIDVEKGEVGDTTALLIRDGKIEALGNKAALKYSGERHNLKGAYILPGLIDAHVHLGNDPKEEDQSRIRHLEYFLRHGITSVRDAAGDARILKDLQSRVKQGKIQGPDIYYAAFIAGAPYYKDNDREKNMVAGLDTAFAPWLQCINRGDNLQKAMRSAKACGATGVKIYGGFTREELFPVIKAARTEGLQIWGHATLFPAKPTDVADAGMRVISHAYLLEWENVSEELSGDFFKNYELYYPKINHKHIDVSRFISSIKKQEAIFDPTLYLCMVNDMKWSAEIVRQAYRAGVKICAGTDYMNDLSRPYPYLFDEIELYVTECGFTTLDAIRSATITAAEALGIKDKTGSVKVGKEANLLILEANPLENIENLKTGKMVIKQGKIIPSI